jgi:hypothetical protein
MSKKRISILNLRTFIDSNNKIGYIRYVMERIGRFERFKNN